MDFQHITNTSWKDIKDKEERIYKNHLNDIFNGSIPNNIIAEEIFLSYVKSESEFYRKIVEYEVLGKKGTKDNLHDLSVFVVDVVSVDSKNEKVDVFFFPVSRMIYMWDSTKMYIYSHHIECKDSPIVYT